MQISNNLNIFQQESSAILKILRIQIYPNFEFLKNLENCYHRFVAFYENPSLSIVEVWKQTQSYKTTLY